MHVDFIPYGERSLVEKLLREMEAQKHLLPMTKGKKKKYLKERNPLQQDKQSEELQKQDKPQ